MTPVRTIDGLTFDRALSARVAALFPKERSRKADKGRAFRNMVIKAFVLLSSWTFLWSMAAFGNLSGILFFANWALMGFFVSSIGMSLGHPAMHGAIGSGKDRWIGILAFDIIAGVNSYIWHLIHNVLHHIHTNTEKDPDPNLPGLRLAPWQKRHWMHRFQHIYAWPLFSLATILWVLFKDFVKFATLKGGKSKGHPTKEWVRLFAFKAIHLSLYIGVPVFVGGVAFTTVALGYLAMHAVQSIYLLLIFESAHVVDDAEFFPDERPKSRAQLQVETTCDFAPGSWFFSFFAGRLNRQRPHHLYAEMSDEHYEELAGEIEDVCREYGVKCVTYDTFWDAIKAQYRHLKNMGRPVKTPEAVTA